MDQQQHVRGRRWLVATVCGLLLGAAGCGGDDDHPQGNRGPSVSTPLPTEFFVGEETTVFFKITDPEGDPYTVKFDVRTRTDFSLYDISDRARVLQVDGGADFSWTPIAADVGEFTVGINAQDDHGHVGRGIVAAHVFATRP